MAEPTEDRRLDERVAALEGDIRNVGVILGQLREDIRETSRQIGDLTRRKDFPWIPLGSLMTAIVGLMGSFLAALGGMGYWVLQSETGHLDEMLTAHVRDGHPYRVEKQVALLGERNTALESQIIADQQIRNLQLVHLYRLLNEERRDSGHEPFDPAVIRDNVMPRGTAIPLE